MRRLFLLSLGLLLACEPRPVEHRETLRRQPLARAQASGWARVVLDAEAQRGFPGLWIGDAEGRSVPFLVERDGLWQPRELTLAKRLLGRDAAGRPVADFTLKLPEGWQVREREHLRIRLDLAGTAPWVCRVGVVRFAGAGEGVALEGDPPRHVFDLGEGRHAEVVVPWDATRYRLTLEAAQGVAPRIEGLSVVAATEPGARAEDLILTPRMTEAADGSWLLEVDAPDRIVGAEVDLVPPVAPVAPGFSLPAGAAGEEGRAPAECPVPSVGMLWKLPALGPGHSRVAFGPVTTDRLRMRLPEGARPAAARLLVRRDALVFPAEAGRTYFLHTGGRVKAAPGNLAALPDSSRTLFQRAPLALGPGDADPQGLPKAIPQPNPAVRWLPWVAGTAVLGLGLVGFRLLRER